MDTRKLQEVGGGTYTVSVPKEWAREHRLEAGATLHLYPRRDGSLVVRTAERDGGDLDEARLEVGDERPETARRALTTAHTAGFDTVTLAAADGFTREQRHAVATAAQELAGTEVVAEGDGEITARNLLDATDVSVRQSVVQLQFTAASLHREAVAAFLEADGGAAARLAGRDDEADRLCSLVARHFHRSLTSLAELDRLDISRPALFDAYATARELEGVAAGGVALARLAGSLSAPPPDDVAGEFRDAADAAGEAVDAAVTAVLDGGNAEAAHAALDRRDDARSTLDALDRALLGGGGFDVPAADAAALARAVGVLARTAEHGGAVATVAMRAATRAREQ